MTSPLSIIADSEPSLQFFTPSCTLASRGPPLLDPALVPASPPAPLWSGGRVNNSILQGQHSKSDILSADSSPALPSQQLGSGSPFISGDHESSPPPSSTSIPVPGEKPLLEPLGSARLGPTWVGHDYDQYPESSNSWFAFSPNELDLPELHHQAAVDSASPFPGSSHTAQFTSPTSILRDFIKDSGDSSKRLRSSCGRGSEALPKFHSSLGNKVSMEERIEDLEAEVRRYQTWLQTSRDSRISELEEMRQVKSLLRRVVGDALEVVKQQYDRIACPHAIFVAGCSANLAYMHLNGIPHPPLEIVPAMALGTAGPTSVSDGEFGSSISEWDASGSPRMMNESSHWLPQGSLPWNYGCSFNHPPYFSPGPYYSTPSPVSIPLSPLPTPLFWSSLDLGSTRDNLSSTTTPSGSRLAPLPHPSSYHPQERFTQRFDSCHVPVEPLSVVDPLPRPPLVRPVAPREQLVPGTTLPTGFPSSFGELDSERRDSPQGTWFKHSMLSQSRSPERTTLLHDNVEAQAEDSGRIFPLFPESRTTAGLGTFLQHLTDDLTTGPSLYNDVIEKVPNKRSRSSTYFDEEYSDHEFTGTPENHHLFAGERRQEDVGKDSPHMRKHIKLEPLSP